MGAEACRPELLERYLDGALSARLHRRVEDHLRTCAACRATLEGMRLVSELWRGELAQAAQRADFTGFEARVLAAATRAPRLPLGERLRAWWGEWQRAWRPVWVTAAVTAGVLLLVLLPLLTREPASRVPAAEPGGTHTAALGAPVDNEVIIDSLEYRGQRSMVYSVSRNNTTVIWLVDFDEQATKDQGEDL